MSFRLKEPSVFSPLAGEDLYVTLADVTKYREALPDFWRELGMASLPLASERTERDSLRLSCFLIECTGLADSKRLPCTATPGILLY